jgi:hypothetical protein
MNIDEQIQEAQKAYEKGVRAGVKIMINRLKTESDWWSALENHYVEKVMNTDKQEENK